MNKFLLSISILLGFAAFGFGQKDATTTTLQLKVGDTAPNFTLTDTTGEKVTLSDLRGKNNVVLAFYVFAFTGG